MFSRFTIGACVGPSLDACMRRHMTHEMDKSDAELVKHALALWEWRQNYEREHYAELH